MQEISTSNNPSNSIIGSYYNGVWKLALYVDILASIGVLCKHVRIVYMLPMAAISGCFRVLHVFGGLIPMGEGSVRSRVSSSISKCKEDVATAWNRGVYFAKNNVDLGVLGFWGVSGLLDMGLSFVEGMLLTSNEVAQAISAKRKIRGAFMSQPIQIKRQEGAQVAGAQGNDAVLIGEALEEDMDSPPGYEDAISDVDAAVMLMNDWEPHDRRGEN